MPPQAGAVLLDLYFLRSAGHLDLGAIIQIARFGALKPDHFATFFCHGTSRTIRFVGPAVPDLRVTRFLRQDLGHNARADGFADFADSEAQFFFHGDWRLELDFDRHVVAG